MQIESLSKRLDKKLFHKVRRGDVPYFEGEVCNIWRVVKRMPMKDWKELSPAQVTTKIVDPMLDVFAASLETWPDPVAAELPLVEDDVVACACCNDGQVPVRMLLCPTPDEEEIVIVVEMLAKPE